MLRALETVHQDHLEKTVRSLFPQENVISKSKQTSQVINDETGKFFELDVWIPNLKLGFEFQDRHHYINTWYSQRPLEKVQNLDDNKRSATSKLGITLVTVPCWWDGTNKSLIATIRFERPDLFTGTNSRAPIFLNPNIGFFPSQELPDIGSLMLASFPVKDNFARKVRSNVWWIGEKYDGMRYYWNAPQRIIYSRTGSEILLPDRITETIPSISLDGEFWFGRGMFHLIYLLFNGSMREDTWTTLRMISFDSPQLNLLSFEQRYSLLIHFASNHPLIIVAHRVLCEGRKLLQALFRRILDFGGEGVILRRVGSHYVRGRTKYLIKLKDTNRDLEGLVVAVSTNSISLKLMSGQIFKVHMHNVLVSSPPLQIGEVVTFSYERVNSKYIPVNAKIFRRRSDVKWNEIVRNSAYFQGYWTKSSNRKQFFEKYAKAQGFDHRSPEAWYSQSVRKIKSFVGGRRVLFYHNNKISKALMDLFPNIGLQKAGFKRYSHWTQPSNRRQFFEKYAKDHGFDFLSPTGWYSQSNFKILTTKGGSKVLSYHKYSLPQALTDLFPDVALQQSSFNK